MSQVERRSRSRRPGREIYRLQIALILAVGTFVIGLLYILSRDLLFELGSKNDWFSIITLGSFLFMVYLILRVIPTQVILYGTKHIEILGAFKKERISIEDIKSIRRPWWRPFNLWIEYGDRKIRLLTYNENMDAVAWILKGLNPRINVVGLE